MELLHHDHHREIIYLQGGSHQGTKFAFTTVTFDPGLGRKRTGDGPNHSLGVGRGYPQFVAASRVVKCLGAEGWGYLRLDNGEIPSCSPMGIKGEGEVNR